jgi:hypothetical protein
MSFQFLPVMLILKSYSTIQDYDFEILIKEIFLLSLLYIYLRIKEIDVFSVFILSIAIKRRQNEENFRS